jgi:hypothetical protein
MRILNLTSTKAFLLYVIIDILCTGMGMGIPIFNIGFGLITGWYLTMRNMPGTGEINVFLQKLLTGAVITSVVTVLCMLLIWGWSIPLLWSASDKIENFGIPMLLFQPRASLAGWLVLMIFISPFLQFLLTIFSGHLTLIFYFKK